MTKFANRAKMSISSTGTGNVTLNAAEVGYQTFAQAGIVDSDSIRYIIEDGTAWEIGTGLMSSSATVMARTVEESSNSNNALNLTSAAKVLIGITAQDLEANPAPRWTTQPAERLVLNNGGSTAVTLTGVAVDENFPVRYSWDGYSGSTIYGPDSLPPQLASAPSINQSTGVTSLVGSSTASNEGTYYHRTRATDGINTLSSTTRVALSFGLDLSNASYQNKSHKLLYNLLDNDSGSIFPASITFSSDGKRLYVLEQVNKIIYQYSLSVAFDTTTTRYDGRFFDVSSQDTGLAGIQISSDGIHMYTVGFTNDKVYQYTMAVPFEINTASLTSKQLSVGSQLTIPRNLTISPDGSAVYVVGSSSDAVYQYALTTNFDISTASYANKSLDVSAQEPNPYDIEFTHNGKTLIVCGATNDTIFQYELTTAYDISTASYANKSIDVSAQDSGPRGVSISDDDQIMYVMGYSSQTLYQYSAG